MVGLLNFGLGDDFFVDVQRNLKDDGLDVSSRHRVVVVFLLDIPEAEDHTCFYRLCVLHSFLYHRQRYFSGQKEVEEVVVRLFAV